ncbi:methyltransferase family protein [Streptomyces corynorhini]|uniref:DUF1295 domain-containing protein n=1 Tax=Streptomyces corynorhini TaxID=2282652 RepID=A0A370B684_9ACTN|nr:isoprenylcysteine carboxylmethyltransferase family protein [Streptomyces corynorhini]RDG35594.1 DUF1295 domain-containing protein [Streptomyces corynorhini]
MAGHSFRAALRGKSLLVLFLLAAAVLAVASVRELTRWSEPVHRVAAIMTIAYLLWLVLEVRVTARSSASPKAETDRGTVHVYASARLITLVAATVPPPYWTEYQPWLLVLVALFLGGVALRLAAIRTLGRFYSHRVRALSDHSIVTTGPYRYLRHPAYTGMILANLAFVSFFINAWSAAALMVLFLPTLMVRIHVEERMLFTLAGYREFAASRRRLIPFVW